MSETVSAHLTPPLRALSSALRRGARGVEGGKGTEALHDFRVALRKLRSLLRSARPVYGKFHTDAVRAALKSVGAATGELRDEEVLGETLAALEVPDASRAALARWAQRRHRRERGLRDKVVAVLHSAEFAHALALLDALLTLPVVPSRDRPLERFASRVVLGAWRDVERRKGVATDDVTALHDLRIRYKRLRYAVDGFAGALPPELAAMGPIAAKFQKRLGDVHDLDVATVVVAATRALGPRARADALAALARARQGRVAKFVAERTGARAGGAAKSAAPAATVRAHAARGTPVRAARPAARIAHAAARRKS